MDSSGWFVSGGSGSTLLRSAAPLLGGEMFDEKGPHGCFWSMVSFTLKPDLVII